MYELKPVSEAAIPAAIERAKHYRLLNEPAQAESICLDVLRVAPGHVEATVILILALTDQFHLSLVTTFQRALDLAKGLGDYERAYYLGLICERRARAALRTSGHGCGYVAYDWFHQALGHLEQAIELRPAGNDDSLLRWNSCVRTMQKNPQVVPEPEDNFQPALE